MPCGGPIEAKSEINAIASILNQHSESWLYSKESQVQRHPEYNRGFISRT